MAEGLDSSSGDYTVAIFEARLKELPDCILEVSWGNDHLGAWFLDDEGRQVLNYGFQKLNDRLFLSNIVSYSYPNRSAESLSGANHVQFLTFSTDGTLREVTIDHDTSAREVVDRNGVDVSKLWEDLPRFGEWESLMRRER
ncbi:hypothetical protein [Nocardia sp. JMUB6875]|uniref:hypothetical protein n=1 Tax=Nocardia sp. JMUB6875 TaxID=3158170 RepID=UPI0034E86ACE